VPVEASDRFPAFWNVFRQVGCAWSQQEQRALREAMAYALQQTLFAAHGDSRARKVVYSFHDEVTIQGMSESAEASVDPTELREHSAR
jgi:hypothetical protein